MPELSTMTTLVYVFLMYLDRCSGSTGPLVECRPFPANCVIKYTGSTRELAPLLVIFSYIFMGIPKEKWPSDRRQNG